MKKILIRGISEELDQRIREKAKKEKKTITKIVLECLEKVAEGKESSELNKWFELSQGQPLSEEGRKCFEKALKWQKKTSGNWMKE